VVGNVGRMALARWKDLCLDATTPADPQPVARFWADVLGLTLEERDDGVTSLRGDPAERTTWVNPVPERKTVKNRVHPDVRIELDRVLELGATVLRSPDAEISWHLCADPGGNEFCVFAPADGGPRGFYELVVDTADPQAQADWWADVLGGTSGADPVHPWCWVEALPGAPFEYLVFTPVPEPKTVKNRWHWDVVSDDLDGLLAKGATLLRAPDDDIDWHVLADPEGNEFCVFSSS
jgi:predicted enzyme related to lactoylglutathione lyase